MNNYSGGYVVNVLVDGQLMPVRKDGIISLPFGADYVIRLTNKNKRNAVAKVSVDGNNVTGGGIIVYGFDNDKGYPNYVDLERPVDKAITFRFASTESQAAIDHGKDGPDVDGTKGLLTVEWRPEKEIYPYGTGYYGALAKSFENYKPRKIPHWGPSGQSSLHAQNSAKYETKTMSFCDAGDSSVLHKSSLTSGGIKLPEENLQSGVTVEGRYSAQSFTTVPFTVDYAMPSTIISLKLKGYSVEQGMPAEGTLYCPSCRTSTKKPTDKFCRKCGEKF